MEDLKSMKKCLMAQAQSQMGNLYNVDAKELGEVVDMIKDLEEAIYYCTITKAMEQKDEDKKETMYYPEPIYRGGDRGGNNSQSSNNTGGRMYYEERRYPEYEYPMKMDMHDPREGRSPIMRRMYMESKQMHHGKEKQMHELEDYMKELSKDITEMIEDATPEEKQVLQQKLADLVSKIK